MFTVRISEAAVTGTCWCTKDRNDPDRWLGPIDNDGDGAHLVAKAASVIAGRVFGLH